MGTVGRFEWIWLTYKKNIYFAKEKCDVICTGGSLVCETEGGGKGVKNRPNMCDVIYEWPLTSDLLHVRVRACFIQIWVMENYFRQFKDSPEFWNIDSPVLWDTPLW